MITTDNPRILGANCINILSYLVAPNILILALGKLKYLTQKDLDSHDKNKFVDLGKLFFARAEWHI